MVKYFPEFQIANPEFRIINEFLATKIINEVLVAKNSVTAAANTAGLTVTLDTQNRKLVDWIVSVSGAASIYVEVSDDNVNWYSSGLTYNTTAATTIRDWDFIGFRYVRVRVPTTAIDITIIISAKL